MESQRSEVKECFTRATTRHNSKQSNIHHASSPELSFSLVCYSLCYRISGSTSSLLARQSQRFFLNIIPHIYTIFKKIELCGVARAFVQISENGPRSKKFGPVSNRKETMALKRNKNEFYLHGPTRVVEVTIHRVARMRVKPNEAPQNVWPMPHRATW